MNYRLKVSNRFKKELKKLDKEDIHTIKESLDNLLKDPFASNENIIPIVDQKNPQMYRMRIGNYRIIYIVQDDEVRVGIIFDRKKGYKRFSPLKQYF